MSGSVTFTGAAKPALCGQGHKYFVAATVGIEKEGKVVVIALCTVCGTSFAKDFQVSGGPGPLQIEEKGS